MGSREGSRRKRTVRRLGQPERIAAFLVAALVPLGLALRGGAIGLIERQEFAVGLWMVLLAGFLLGVLPRAQVPREARLSIAAGIALAGWIALALIWTDSVERTVAELARYVGYLGVATLALATVHAGNWRAAAAGLFAGAVAVCLLALASRLAPSVDWGPVAALGQERLNYPLEYWNALAQVAVIAVLLGVGFGCFGDRSVRPLALAAVPAAGLVLYLTLSRGGLLALAGGALVLGLLSSDRRKLAIPVAACALGTAALVLLIRSQPELADATGGAGGGLVAVATLVVAVACGASARRAARRDRERIGPPRAQGRLRLAASTGTLAIAVLFAIAVALLGSGAPAGSPGQLNATPVAPDPAARLVSLSSPRYRLWFAALDGFAEHPVTGSGPGTFSYVWDASGRDDDLVVDSHSLLLDSLSEMGLPGAVLLVGALVALGFLAFKTQRSSRRRRDHGLLAALIAAFAAFALQSEIDWLWEVPAVGVLGLACVLLAVASGSHSRSARRLGALPRSLIVIAALASIAIQVPGIVSQDRIESSRDASRANQDGLVVDLAGDAIAAAPWFASPYARRAEAELGARQLDAARADAAAAAEREPLEWRHAMLQARIALAGGDRQGAIAALKRVAELRPASRPLIGALQDAVRSGNPSALEPFAP